MPICKYSRIITVEQDHVGDQAYTKEEQYTVTVKTKEISCDKQATTALKLSSRRGVVVRVRLVKGDDYCKKHGEKRYERWQSNLEETKGMVANAMKGAK